MKRYVIELANDVKHSLSPNKDIEHQKQCTIDRIVKAYKRGLITEFEAVKELVKVW